MKQAGAVQLIGWDAAVNPRDCGLARVVRAGSATADDYELTVAEVVRPVDGSHLVHTVADWIRMGPDETLLCVDSPIGWPAGLASALVDHRAGYPLSGSADELFRRCTDLDIKARVGKTPLDVGADRIARTARTTLEAIAHLRRLLADEGGPAIVAATDVAACVPSKGRVPLIESYPAGWFASEGIVTSGYRPRDAQARRLDLLASIRDALARKGIGYASAVDEAILIRRADDLDAVVCTLNGIDALEGRCPPPTGQCADVVEREGWIWCKSPTPS